MEERNSSSHVVFGKVCANAAKYEMDSLVWLCNSNFDARRITVKSTELKRLSVLQNPEYVPVRTDKLCKNYNCLQNFRKGWLCMYTEGAYIIEDKHSRPS